MERASLDPPRSAERGSPSETGYYSIYEDCASSSVAEISRDWRSGFCFLCFALLHDTLTD